jgi:hypothetical protein
VAGKYGRQGNGGFRQKDVRFIQLVLSLQQNIQKMVTSEQIKDLVKRIDALRRFL